MDLREHVALGENSKETQESSNSEQSTMEVTIVSNVSKETPLDGATPPIPEAILETNPSPTPVESTSESTSLTPTSPTTTLSKTSTLIQTTTAHVISTADMSNDISPAFIGDNTPPASPTCKVRRARKPRQPEVQSASVTLNNGNTMDNYLKKTCESPSTKRKHSDGVFSPSSVQVAKTTRTDGGDDVS